MAPHFFFTGPRNYIVNLSHTIVQTDVSPHYLVAGAEKRSRRVEDSMLPPNNEGWNESGAKVTRIARKTAGI